MGTCNSQPLVKGNSKKDHIDGFKQIKKKLASTTTDSDAVSTRDMSKKEDKEWSKTEHDTESDKTEEENLYVVSEISNTLSENNSFKSPKTPETRLPNSPNFGASVNFQRRSRQLDHIDNSKFILLIKI